MTPARAEVVKQLVECLEAAQAWLSVDGGGLELPEPSLTGYPDRAARFEGWARLWWGIAALRAGAGPDGPDGGVPGWQRMCAGLVSGPSWWGDPGPHDQRLVDCAPLAFAILTLPELRDADAPWREPLRKWLGRAVDRSPGENNQRIFHAMTRLAHQALGGSLDEAGLLADLQSVDAMAAADGAWADGRGGPWDHYNGWAFVPLTLLVAHWRAAADPVRAARWRAAAATFLPIYATLFGADGLPVPYGRSLSYRAACAAGWGALALVTPADDASMTARDWVALRERALRPLAALGPRGRPTSGWTFAHRGLAEPYSGPWSAHWSLMAFMPLALPATHPFWSTPAREPEPALEPETAPSIHALRAARAVVMRDPARDHVVLLASGHAAPRWLPGAAARYARFAYSNRAGFGLDGALDSTLAVYDLMGRPFVRARAEDAYVDGDDVVVCDWRSMPSVCVRTWLVACPPWHVRVHRVDSLVPLHTREGGFLCGLEPDDEPRPITLAAQRAGLCATSLGTSHLIDLSPAIGRPARVATIELAPPGTPIMTARALVPTLATRLRPLRDWLACAAAFMPARDGTIDDPGPPPALARTRHGFVVTHAGRARTISRGL